MRNNAHTMIEQQIATEINKLNSIMTDEDEKPAIIQRIAELKAMLDSPAPTVTVSESKTLGDVLSELIQTWRNRH